MLLFFKAIGIGLVAGIVGLILGGLLGGLFPDSLGNHWNSWTWALYGFPVGAILGFGYTVWRGLKKKQ